jgi:hypothetical protein
VTRNLVFRSDSSGLTCPWVRPTSSSKTSPLAGATDAKSFTTSSSLPSWLPGIMTMSSKTSFILRSCLGMSSVSRVEGPRYVVLKVAYHNKPASTCSHGRGRKVRQPIDGSEAVHVYLFHEAPPQTLDAGLRRQESLTSSPRRSAGWLSTSLNPSK